MNSSRWWQPLLGLTLRADPHTLPCCLGEGRFCPACPAGSRLAVLAAKPHRRDWVWVGALLGHSDPSSSCWLQAVFSSQYMSPEEYFSLTWEPLGGEFSQGDQFSQSQPPPAYTCSFWLPPCSGAQGSAWPRGPPFALSLRENELPLRHSGQVHHGGTWVALGARLLT